MVSFSKSNKEVSVIVSYDVEESTYNLKVVRHTLKKGVSPILTMRSANPVKILDAIETEANAKLAYDVMRPFAAQLKARCKVITKELATLVPSLKDVAAKIRKSKGDEEVESNVED